MNEVEQIEISIEQAKNKVARHESFVRLSKNKDFINIIENGYFKDEAIRLVMARSNTALTEENLENTTRQMDGIGSLFNYFITICQEGIVMAQSITDDENTREEMAAEELK